VGFVTEGVGLGCPDQVPRPGVGVSVGHGE
jgi:hypothetical protein